MAGPVSLERSLYRAAGKRNAKTVDTVSLLTGVFEDGWLPHTARTMAFLLSQQPSREAANAAHELGRLPYHRSSFERVGHAVGQSYHHKSDVIEERLIEKAVVPDAARSISVSIDRVSLPMEETVEAQPATKPWPKFPERPGWRKRRVSRHHRREIAREMQAQPARVARVYRMAYCATVTLHDADSKGLHTIRYGKMPNTKPQTLCHRLAADICALRTRRPDLNVSFVADGAPEIWNLFEAHLSKRTIGTEASRTIDYYHLMEYLAPAAHLIVARKRRAPGLEIQNAVTSHRLRHSYATEMMTAGVSMAGVMKLLGHRDYRMTLRYTEITLETVGAEYYEALTRIEKRYEITLRRSYEHEPVDPDRMLADIMRWLKREAGDDEQKKRHARKLIRRLRRLRKDVARGL